MKRILSLVLAMFLIFTLVACGKKENKPESKVNSSSEEKIKTESNDTVTSNSSETTSNEFVEPKDYAVILQLSINPQFKIYLDKNFNVLGVKALNDDAVEVLKNCNNIVDFTFEKVIDMIISAGKDKGYVKRNSPVNIEVFYLDKKTANAEEINIRMKTLTTDMSQKYGAIVKFKTEDNNKTENSKPATSSKPATPSKPATSSKPAESSKPVVPVISEAEALECIDPLWISDDTERIGESDFKFIYDIVFFEKANAKYAIKRVTISGATVDGGKQCEVIQTSTKAKARNFAEKFTYMSEYFKTFEAQLLDNGYAETEAACRIKSPVLVAEANGLEKEYSDFTIEVKIEFKNGAVTIVKFVGTQSPGVGGYAFRAIKDSDYN